MTFSPDVSSPATPTAPPFIPDYELIRSVGRGAYGDVWLARSLTGVYRAVKIVWRDRFSDSQPYEREFSGLRDFARISINESRQLALLHVGRNDAAGLFYYVMELADDVETGTTIDPARYEPLTLTRYREKSRRLPVRQIVAHAVELARALASLHDHGLVHRDIKPSNIVIVNGQAKLADIGLVTTAASAVTYVGTEGFVPPEGPGTPAADVYSMGKVLYELAMGRDRNDYPRLPEDLQERADRKELMELNEVILRACDPSPAVRYANAEALLNELLLLQAGKSVRRLRLTERGLARARRGAIVLTVLALMAAAGMAIERQRAERESAGRRAAEAERDLLQRQTVYSAILARAQRAIHLGELGRARKILREAVPRPGEENQDLRGWEWHVLQNEARGDSTAVIMEGPHAIERVVHSPDGTLLAVLDATKTVTILDASTYERRSTVSGVHRLAGFSPDGEWLLGTTNTFALQAWNHTTGATLGDAQSSGVNRPLAVLPDAPMHLLVFTDGTVDDPPVVRAWDLAEQREVYRIPVGEPGGPLWEYFLAAVSANGKRAAFTLITGSRNNRIFRDVVIDLVGLRATYDVSTRSRPTALALSSTGDLFARALGNAAEISLVELGTGTQRWTVSAESEVLTLSFSPSDNQLIAGTFVGWVYLLDPIDGSRRRTTPGQAGPISTLSWGPTRETVASGGSSGDVRSWTTIAPERSARVKNLWAPLNWQVACSPDGRRVAAPSTAQTVTVFDGATLNPLSELPNAQHPIWFSGDSSSLVTLDPEGTAYWWRIGETTPYNKLEFNLPPGVTVDARIHDRSSTLMAATSAGEVQFWDLSTRKIRSTVLAHQRNVRLLRIDSIGSLAATTGMDGKICFWEPAIATQLFSIQLTPPIQELSLSSELQMAVAVIGDGVPSLIDLKKQQVSRELSLGNAIMSTLFLPTRSRLICASRSGLLHVVETGSWQEITALEDTDDLTPGDSTANAMETSRDGGVLVAFSRNRQLRLWRALE